MSLHGNVLFLRGQAGSGALEDEWDDTELIEEYDYTMARAKAEMAKRISELPNNLQRSTSELLDNLNSNTRKTKKSKKHGTDHKWRIGSNCRAVFSEDQVEYEATIVNILNHDLATVKYLGYNNEEDVMVSSLKESLGPLVINHQLKQALDDGYDDDNIGASSVLTEPRVMNGNIAPNKTRKKKKKASSQTSDLHDSLENLRASFCSPPINPFGFQCSDAGAMSLGIDEDSIGLNSHDDPTSDGPLTAMLVSWYLSGYYTGYYKGLERGKKSRRRCKKD